MDQEKNGNSKGKGKKHTKRMNNLIDKRNININDYSFHAIIEAIPCLFWTHEAETNESFTFRVETETLGMSFSINRTEIR